LERLVGARAKEHGRAAAGDVPLPDLSLGLDLALDGV
jgi:hypothetical protein